MYFNYFYHKKIIGKITADDLEEFGKKNYS
jgi:hypothetical protein